MFIAQAYRVKHEFWRYILGFGIVGFAYAVGQLPFMGALLIAVGWEKIEFLEKSELMTVLDNNTTLFLILFCFLIALIGMIVAIRFLHEQDIRAVTTTRNHVDWKRIFFIFFVTAVFIFTLTIIDFQMNPQHYIWNFQWKPFLILCCIAIPMFPIQTSFEEYLFRGYLMQGVGVLAKNKWVPLFMTSVLFGALHWSNPESEKLGVIVMLYYIGTGLFLGIITLMDEGMELALGFHAANNLVTSLLVTADWSVLQTNSILEDVSEPSTGIDILLPVFIFYPLVILLLAKKYKWNGWKEKLFGRVSSEINQQHITQ